MNHENQEPRHEPQHQANQAHDLGFELPQPARVSKGKVVLYGAIALGVLGAAFVVGLVPRLTHKHGLAEGAKEAAAPTPRVQVVQPKKITADRALTLPGSVLPLEETIVYPHTNGYVRAWHKDLGDKVAEGELLAEIDTPELDQQLAQARAQLAQAEAGIVQAKANANFSKKNADRYGELQKEGVASAADLEKNVAQADVDKASVSVAGANAAAMRANIARLVDLKGYARVTAPFAGTVTMRSAERGNLVTEGTTTPLFKISATDPVRVIVQIPQDVAASTKPGMKTKVSVRELKGAFEGTVARTAGALDAVTRTMAAEVRVPNADNQLLTGMYATVAFELATPRAVYEVPITALLTDAQGTRLATVDANDAVHFVTVVVDRDTGSAIEIGRGLEGTERVVKLPGPELVEGRKVEIATPAPASSR